MTDKEFSDLEKGMTYVEKLDFREQLHRHQLERDKAHEEEETKRAKYKLRVARQQTYQTVGIGILVTIVVLSVILWIYMSTAGNPNKGPDVEVGREEACLSSGGGWVPSDLLRVGDRGLCVYPGKKVEAPADS